MNEYLDHPKARFKAPEVASTRGTPDSAPKNAPELRDLVMSSFDDMLSNNALTFGDKKPHPAYEPSPAMPDSGETEEEGQQMLRLSLSVAWGVVVMNNGAYVYRSFEDVLELEHRDALPRKGGPRSSCKPESDSSGKGWFYIDPHTGKYIQLWFTAEQL